MYCLNPAITTMNDPHARQLLDAPKKIRFGSWAKLGGGALTFAILLHVTVLTIAGNL